MCRVFYLITRFVAEEERGKVYFKLIFYGPLVSICTLKFLFLIEIWVTLNFEGKSSAWATQRWIKHPTISFPLNKSIEKPGRGLLMFKDPIYIATQAIAGL